MFVIFNAVAWINPNRLRRCSPTFSLLALSCFIANCSLVVRTRALADSYQRRGAALQVSVMTTLYLECVAVHVRLPEFKSETLVKSICRLPRRARCKIELSSTDCGCVFHSSSAQRLADTSSTSVRINDHIFDPGMNSGWDAIDGYS